MNTVITMLLMIILGSFQDETDSEIAKQLIKNAHRISTLPMAELSDACQCSPSTLHKFARRLGFDDFTRLRTQMVTTMKVRRDQLIHRHALTSEETLLKRLKLLSDESFEETAFIRIVRQFNEHIHADQELYILAAGYPQAIALNYIEDMIIMGKNVIVCPIGYRPQLPVIRERAAVAIITLTGKLFDYFREPLEKLAQENTDIFVFSARSPAGLLAEKTAVIHVPVTGDDENANVLLAEMLRYIKYMYFQAYGV